VQNEAVLAQSL